MNTPTQVTWDFGSAGSASGDTTVFDFGESGLYAVTLTIENDECGTSQSADFEVYVPELIADVELVIPNVLTPNADGKNDRFRVGHQKGGRRQRVARQHLFIYPVQAAGL